MSAIKSSLEMTDMLRIKQHNYKQERETNGNSFLNISTGLQTLSCAARMSFATIRTFLSQKRLFTCLRSFKVLFLPAEVGSCSIIKIIQLHPLEACNSL